MLVHSSALTKPLLVPQPSPLCSFAAVALFFPWRTRWGVFQAPCVVNVLPSVGSCSESAGAQGKLPPATCARAGGKWGAEDLERFSGDLQSNKHFTPLRLAGAPPCFTSVWGWAILIFFLLTPWLASLQGRGFGLQVELFVFATVLSWNRGGE